MPNLPPCPLLTALALELPLPVDTALATAMELPRLAGVMATGGAPGGAGGATCGFHQHTECNIVSFTQAMPEVKCAVGKDFHISAPAMIHFLVPKAHLPITVAFSIVR